MHTLIRAAFAIIGLHQCSAVWAHCEPPKNTRTDVGAARHLLKHFDLVGLAVVTHAQDLRSRQPEKLHLPLTFKGEPGEVILQSPLNLDGTITVTNSQTSLGLPAQGAAVVALTKVGDAFVISECAAAVLGGRSAAKLLRALSRLKDAQLAK